MGAEEEEVAKMGCPSLGEHTQLEVVIEESYEFKVSVCNNAITRAGVCERLNPAGSLKLNVQYHSFILQWMHVEQRLLS